MSYIVLGRLSIKYPDGSIEHISITPGTTYFSRDFTHRSTSTVPSIPLNNSQINHNYYESTQIINIPYETIKPFHFAIQLDNPLLKPTGEQCTLACWNLGSNIDDVLFVIPSQNEHICYEKKNYNDTFLSPSSESLQIRAINGSNKLDNMNTSHQDTINNYKENDNATQHSEEPFQTLNKENIIALPPLVPFLLNENDLINDNVKFSFLAPLTVMLHDIILTFTWLPQLTQFIKGNLNIKTDINSSYLSNVFNKFSNDICNEVDRAQRLNIHHQPSKLITQTLLLSNSISPPSSATTKPKSLLKPYSQPALSHSIVYSVICQCLYDIYTQSVFKDQLKVGNSIQNVIKTTFFPNDFFFKKIKNFDLQKLQHISLQLMCEQLNQLNCLEISKLSLVLFDKEKLQNSIDQIFSSPGFNENGKTNNIDMCINDIDNNSCSSSGKDLALSYHKENIHEAMNINKATTSNISCDVTVPISSSEFEALINSAINGSDDENSTTIHNENALKHKCSQQVTQDDSSLPLNSSVNNSSFSFSASFGREIELTISQRQASQREKNQNLSQSNRPGFTSQDVPPLQSPSQQPPPQQSPSQKPLQQQSQSHIKSPSHFPPPQHEQQILQSYGDDITNSPSSFSLNEEIEDALMFEETQQFNMLKNEDDRTNINNLYLTNTSSTSHSRIVGINNLLQSRENTSEANCYEIKILNSNNDDNLYPPSNDNMKETLESSLIDFESQVHDSLLQNDKNNKVNNNSHPSMIEEFAHNDMGHDFDNNMEDDFNTTLCDDNSSENNNEDEFNSIIIASDCEENNYKIADNANFDQDKNSPMQTSLSASNASMEQPLHTISFTYSIAKDQLPSNQDKQPLRVVDTKDNSDQTCDKNVQNSNILSTDQNSKSSNDIEKDSGNRPVLITPSTTKTTTEQIDIFPRRHTIASPHTTSIHETFITPSTTTIPLREQKQIMNSPYRSQSTPCTQVNNNSYTALGNNAIDSSTNEKQLPNIQEEKTESLHEGNDLKEFNCNAKDSPTKASTTITTTLSYEPSIESSIMVKHNHKLIDIMTTKEVHKTTNDCSKNEENDLIVDNGKCNDLSVTSLDNNNDKKSIIDQIHFTEITSFESKCSNPPSHLSDVVVLKPSSQQTTDVQHFTNQTEEAFSPVPPQVKSISTTIADSAKDITYLSQTANNTNHDNNNNNKIVSNNSHEQQNNIHMLAIDNKVPRHSPTPPQSPKKRQISQQLSQNAIKRQNTQVYFDKATTPSTCQVARFASTSLINSSTIASQRATAQKTTVVQSPIYNEDQILEPIIESLLLQKNDEVSGPGGRARQLALEREIRQQQMLNDIGSLMVTNSLNTQSEIASQHDTDDEIDCDDNFVDEDHSLYIKSDIINNNNQSKNDESKDLLIKETKISLFFNFKFLRLLITYLTSQPTMSMYKLCYKLIKSNYNQALAQNTKNVKGNNNNLLLNNIVTTPIRIILYTGIREDKRFTASQLGELQKTCFILDDISPSYLTYGLDVDTNYHLSAPFIMCDQMTPIYPTHIITDDNFGRSLKLLSSYSTCSHVVTLSWLEDSIQKQEWLPEDEYGVNTDTTGKEWDFSHNKSLQNNRFNNNNKNNNLISKDVKNKIEHNKINNIVQYNFNQQNSYLLKQYNDLLTKVDDYYCGLQLQAKNNKKNVTLHYGMLPQIKVARKIPQYVKPYLTEWDSLRQYIHDTFVQQLFPVQSIDYSKGCFDKHIIFITPKNTPSFVQLKLPLQAAGAICLPLQLNPEDIKQMIIGTPSFPSSSQNDQHLVASWQFGHTYCSSFYHYIISLLPYQNQMEILAIIRAAIHGEQPAIDNDLSLSQNVYELSSQSQNSKGSTRTKQIGAKGKKNYTKEATPEFIISIIHQYIIDKQFCSTNEEMQLIQHSPDNNLDLLPTKSKHSSLSLLQHSHPSIALSSLALWMIKQLTCQFNDHIITLVQDIFNDIENPPKFPWYSSVLQQQQADQLQQQGQLSSQASPSQQNAIGTKSKRHLKAHTDIKPTSELMLSIAQLSQWQQVQCIQWLLYTKNQQFIAALTSLAGYFCISPSYLNTSLQHGIMRICLKTQCGVWSISNSNNLQPLHDFTQMMNNYIIENNLTNSNNKLTSYSPFYSLLSSLPKSSNKQKYTTSIISDAIDIVTQIISEENKENTASLNHNSSPHHDVIQSYLFNQTYTKIPAQSLIKSIYFILQNDKHYISNQTDKNDEINVNQIEHETDTKSILKNVYDVLQDMILNSYSSNPSESTTTYSIDVFPTAILLNSTISHANIINTHWFSQQPNSPYHKVDIEQQTSDTTPLTRKVGLQSSSLKSPFEVSHIAIGLGTSTIQLEQHFIQYLLKNSPNFMNVWSYRNRNSKNVTVSNYSDNPYFNEDIKSLLSDAELLKSFPKEVQSLSKMLNSSSEDDVFWQTVFENYQDSLNKSDMEAELQPTDYKFSLVCTIEELHAHPLLYYWCLINKINIVDVDGGILCSILRQRDTAQSNQHNMPHPDTINNFEYISKINSNHRIATATKSSSIKLKRSRTTDLSDNDSYDNDKSENNSQSQRASARKQAKYRKS